MAGWVSPSNAWLAASDGSPPVGGVAGVAAILRYCLEKSIDADRYWILKDGPASCRAGNMDTYYVRREGRIKGPLTREKLCALRNEKRLRTRDEVSESPDGPWRRLRDIQELVQMTDSLPRSDSGLSGGESPSPANGRAGAAIAEEPDREWHASLQTWVEGDSPFRKPFRPWMYALGAAFLVALAFFALKIVLWPH